MKQKFLLLLFFLLGIAGLSAQNCFDTGTLLYKEDFQGNSLSDPIQAPTDLSGGYSEFAYGTYLLAKYVVHPSSAWWELGDHTNWPNKNLGYYMFVNPPYNSTGKILYEKQIDGLCDGIEVLLSAWVLDLCKGGRGYVGPKFTLRISDATNNAVLNQTGILTPTQWMNESDVKWEQLTLSVVIPNGVNSIKFTLINQEDNGGGNDTGLDDIEIYLCTGPVNVTANDDPSTSVEVVGSTVSFKGDHTNTVLNPDFHSYWLYSTTGDISSFTDWTPVDYKHGACPVGSTWNHDFTFTNAKSGYYRLVVGNSNVLNSLCRAASQVIYISMPEIEIETDITSIICRGVEITFTATPSSFILPYIASMEWDFGDGTVIDDTNIGASISQKHTYVKEGTYNLTLRPKKSDGEVIIEVKTEVKINRCVMPVNPNVHIWQ